MHVIISSVWWYTELLIDLVVNQTSNWNRYSSKYKGVNVWGLMWSQISSFIIFNTKLTVMETLVIVATLAIYLIKFSTSPNIYVRVRTNEWEQTLHGLPQNIPDCAVNILSTLSHPLKIPFQQWTWCMIDTSQVLKEVPSLEWRNLKMVFPESKNYAFILVAHPFCTQ